MRIYFEASFGPLVTVIPVDGPDEAVRVANEAEREFTELRWMTVQEPREYPV